MAVAKFMKSGGMAALAAGLALLALPASANAQDRGHGHWGGGDGDGQSVQGGGGRGDSGGRGGGRGDGDGGGRGGWQSDRGGHGFRSAPSADTPAPAPQARTQERPEARQNWSRGEVTGGNRWNGNRGDGNLWRERQSQAQTPPPAQVAPQRRQWSQGGSGWQSRNGADARGRDDVRRWRNDNDGDRWRNNNTWRGNPGQAWRSDRQSYGNWNRNWRNDHRYDWRGYRSANRGIYRLSPYYAPYRGYSYSRIGIGFYLDSLFFGSRYWIDDPWYYRLPPAEGPYRWIRYYDDALLVDIYSGEVVDVIYDFFW